MASYALARHHEICLAKNVDISIRDVKQTVDDGVELFATLYLPFEVPKGGVPAVLLRTPYGRHTMGVVWARLFAERGYATVLQDTRGRFGSGGDFFPFKDEVRDGAATIDWIVQQDWSNKKVSLFGVSYLGLTSYAAAHSDTAQHVSAIIPVMAGSQIYPLLYRCGSGSFNLDLALRWLWLAVKLLGTINVYKFWIPWFQTELNESFLATTPLCEQDEKLLGEKLDFLQQAIQATHADHEFWEGKNILYNMSNPERPPLHIVAGWYDFFMLQSFQDYEDATKAHTPCQLTVGKWKHWAFHEYGSTAIKIALDMFKRFMEDDEPQSRFDHDITVSYLGTKPTIWNKFKSWPPTMSETTPFELCEMATGDVSCHDYDPSEPTPYVGGASFDPLNSGMCDQSSLEARDDVLVFTGSPQKETLYIAGDVYVQLDAHSTNPYTDFFFKLCDVNLDTGKSHNLPAEHLIRLEPEKWDDKDDDGYILRKRKIKIGPIAQAFQPNHAIRLQVSAGAHPHHMRNLGCGHDIATATLMKPATHKIFHTTTLLLPVISPNDVKSNTTMHPAANIS
eukprot:CAMPEP_0203754178 /NCGR_PEP_ID=MMETSP0098-20131031/7811_1 /ASSEMBLY_ACC=CAM_ASM_000208 /TAXON_ID=96639 /ORGANISM=" , Strain NY0313808BC1" /LENGTH=563 /DNA_ID=CAMNT_0050645073 /DNA_START=135 /DNA_END=1826 /DNA_ORIENTATION=-